MGRAYETSLKKLLVSYSRYYWPIDEEIERLRSRRRKPITRKEHIEEEMRRWEESLLLECRGEVEDLFDLIEEVLTQIPKWSQKALEIRILLWNWIVEGERELSEEYQAITGREGCASLTIERFVNRILREIEDEEELFAISSALQAEEERFHKDFHHQGQEDAD